MKPQDYYWRTIDLPNFHSIQKQIQEFVTESTGLLTRTDYSNNYVNRYNQQVQEAIPDLAREFEQSLGLKIQACAFFVAWPESGTQYPHIDHLVPGNKARINLPVFNCKDTYTTFYTNVRTEEKQQANGEYYNAVVNTDYIEAARVEVIQPTLLRVSEPHAILIDDSKQFPRITITILTKPDAIILFYK